MVQESYWFTVQSTVATPYNHYMYDMKLGRALSTQMPWNAEVGRAKELTTLY